jgi:hypothetical protein
MPMLNKRICVRALPTIGLCLLLCGIGECVIEPPEQPDVGPAGKNYICDPETGVYFEHNEKWIPDPYLGEDLGGYVYAPACAERPAEAPVIFFFHCGAGDRQDTYEKFFRHLAGKNYIVIAPNYHRPPVYGHDPLTAVSKIPYIHWAYAGIAGAKAGVEYYRNTLPGRLDPVECPYGIPAPMLEQGELVYGTVGHSFGTTVAAGLANPTFRNSVPGAEDFDENPRAVVLMMGGQVGDILPTCPGGGDLLWCCPTCFPSPFVGWLLASLVEIENGYLDFDPDNPDDWTPNPDACIYGRYVAGNRHCMATDGSYTSGDLSEITYDPLWIVMSGEDDLYAGETYPLQGYCKASNVTDKQYLRVLSDDHGHPSKNDLKAHHTDPVETDLLYPIWPGKIDAHDYWAYWKIVTAAMNCAVYDQDCNYARGGTDEQLRMGNWSDGEPVKRMQWNPDVRDNDGICYPLEDVCDMVNDVDPVTRESAWNWRGGNVPADCGD